MTARIRSSTWARSSGGTRVPAAAASLRLSFPCLVDLAAAIVRGVGPGVVIFLDTLNRAAPTADENSSRDMGAILEACKELQRAIGGLVVLVHQTGKDATKGLRGHSSLFAALDAAIEVTRNGDRREDRREWLVAKSKDGEDGTAHSFKLRVVELGNDESGQPVTSCVVAPDTCAAEVKRAKVPQGGHQRIVWDALGPLFAKGGTGVPGAPTVRPCIELEAAIVAAAGRLTCDQKRRTERAREAITGLVSRGLLGCVDGWLWVV
jgi:putative DNA primase/helicase